MYFVLSDPHGCYDELKTALTHWNKDSEHLVVLGDLIDRGPDSLKVVRHLMQLQSENPHNVTVLKGNHDASFANWLVDTPNDLLAYYYMDTHRETLLSFFEHNKKKYRKSSRQQRAEHVLFKFKPELRFLHDLPHYFETEHMIFVHAGLNLKINDWRDDTRAILDVRNPFIYSKTPTPKRVFFGHTPTSIIRDIKDNHNVWINKTGDRVGIDGGVSMNGQLNVLRVDHNGTIIDTITIKQGSVKP